MLRIKCIGLLLCFGHRYRQLRGDAVIELHLNVIAAERLDVGVEVDLALVDVEAVLLFNLLRNLLCGDGAEQSAALARLCGDADGLVKASAIRCASSVSVFTLYALEASAFFSSFITCAFASFASLRGSRKLRA